MFFSQDIFKALVSILEWFFFSLKIFSKKKYGFLLSLRGLFFFDPFYFLCGVFFFSTPSTFSAFFRPFYFLCVLPPSAWLAQSVERQAFNLVVEGSSPSLSELYISYFFFCIFLYFL